MTQTLSAKLIIESLSGQLELQWITGENDPEQPAYEVEFSKHATLIGHLNLIHKNFVQVIGMTEHDYLQNTEDNVRANMLKQTFGNKTVAVILADGLPVNKEYIQYANQRHVPLLQCEADSNKVVDVARYCLHELFSEKTIVHGVYMEVLGIGVLLTGASSIGKSELALDLISRGHRLIADDAPEFTRIGPDILDGRSPSLLKDYMEVRGLGVINIREMYGDNALKLHKYLRLIIHMEQMDTKQLEKLDRLLGSRKIRDILGVEIPEILLPVAPGRNLGVLVEAAVRNHILRENGQDASEQLIKLQQQAVNNNHVQ